MHGGVQVGRADSTSYAIIHVSRKQTLNKSSTLVCVWAQWGGLCEITRGH